jgi:nucleotide-binding universal stress UspA family protein
VYSSIVVGTDGSETAQRAVEAAASLARLAGASLEIVSAYESVPTARLSGEMYAVPADLQWIVNPREEVDKTLAGAVERLEGTGLVVRTFALEGDPADAILDVAEERGADLIVVGNKGMTGARRFLLGSVPNKISHHAPCSVLIVRTN